MNVNLSTVTFLGYRLNQRSLEEIVSCSIQNIVANDKGQQNTTVFACANPHSIAVAGKNSSFDRALKNADYLVSDGVGMLLGGRMAGISAGPRIAGYDYFSSLMRALDASVAGALGRRARVFFFGSTEAVLQKIADKFSRDYPEIDVVGVCSPPFGDWDDEKNKKMLAAINDSNPDVIWVGMTAPKQELWVERYRCELAAPIVGSIGAVFDFYAGTYPRAPAWISRLGLEWLVRLIREPRRMWQRNFVSAPKFLWMVIHRYWLRRRY